LYDGTGIPIGSCTTLVRGVSEDRSSVREKVLLVVRVDTDDPSGISLDVDLLDGGGKRIRYTQETIGIPHHNYVKSK